MFSPRSPQGALRQALQVVPTAQFGVAAADRVAALLARHPDALIGLPTGSTPRPLYQTLLRRQRAGELDLSRMRAVMLDEYLGAQGEVSFHHWLRREFLDPAGIGAERVLQMPQRPAAGVELPIYSRATAAATAEAMAAACAAFEEKLRAWGGVDLQLLGLGLNGHIGFNEPGSPADSRTRVVPLTATTVAANAAYWREAESVPLAGVTQGIGTILEAREIGLLVNGENKATILQRVLEGGENGDVPASLLDRAAAVWIVADQAAAAAASATPSR